MWYKVHVDDHPQDLHLCISATFVRVFTAALHIWVESSIEVFPFDSGVLRPCLYRSNQQVWFADHES